MDKVTEKLQGVLEYFGISKQDEYDALIANKKPQPLLTYDWDVMGGLPPKPLFTALRTGTEVKEFKKEWWLHQMQHYPRCEKCFRTNLLTLDHIIPQTILTDMGFNFLEMYDSENLRILCRPCNTLKAYHLDFSTPKTKHLLLKYMSRL